MMKGIEYIDLGLPSGTLWASKNLPEFETHFGAIASIKYSDSPLNGQLPTKTQWEELLKNTIWCWIQQDERKGIEFTGNNGNKIFLPAEGIPDAGGHIKGKNNIGYYLGATEFNPDVVRIYDEKLYYGFMFSKSIAASTDVILRIGSVRLVNCK